MESYIIVAMTKEHLIGKDNTIPWHLPEDLKRFKSLTIGNTIIMGRKTYESIGKPLPGRNNIVVSRQMPKAPGLEVFGTLDEAYEFAKESGKDIFFIGGRQIYEEALKIAKFIYISWIEGEFSGDIYFPDFDLKCWKRLKVEQFEGFSLALYEREA